MNTAWQKRKAAEVIPATFEIRWQPIRDTLRNFFLSPPAEMLSFWQQLREAV